MGLWEEGHADTKEGLPPSLPLIGSLLRNVLDEFTSRIGHALTQRTSNHSRNGNILIWKDTYKSG